MTYTPNVSRVCFQYGPDILYSASKLLTKHQPKTYPLVRFRRNASRFCADLCVPFGRALCSFGIHWSRFSRAPDAHGVTMAEVPWSRYFLPFCPRWYAARRLDGFCNGRVLVHAPSLLEYEGVGFSAPRRACGEWTCHLQGELPLIFTRTHIDRPIGWFEVRILSSLILGEANGELGLKLSQVSYCFLLRVRLTSQLPLTMIRLTGDVAWPAWTSFESALGVTN